AALVLDAKRMALSDEPAAEILSLIQQRLETGVRKTAEATQPLEAEVAAPASAVRAIERSAGRVVEAVGSQLSAVGEN
ncbi:MAG: hypothetical protein H0W76_29795, partial [Pyrinomonadaceae bacterium]|nr:hypothetical protein [Pyrinomonadaceae bacterium]